ncbi:serine hydrolase domain-containing protein [Nocardia sp. CDC153]|uniref:serine hydrolase domain-containing protein n=1 Tax=Nocardia sp. CDC153 TaxID=3112167 RepID=UPI002DB91102|nr:serine hydrolase domain-containing protein [Nocardia sp. CDC153]MEC3955977.1 serine hydrolase domain-containing protein [Nocardia sp. CDC153]
MLRYAKVFGAACVLALALCACGTDGRGNAPAAPSYADVGTILDRLTGADGAPGALLEVSDAHGRTVLTRGVANIDTHAPMVGDSRFRIGSMTKMFVATVVLQLVGEQKVGLDTPVEQYLPGLIKGNGNDGRDITVRHLLQHTSGLPDYVQYLDLTELVRNPGAHHDPLDLVNLALDHPRLFAPGNGWQYSNTDYVVAGLLIEKVTGQPYAEEIERRIIHPLALDGTSVPGDDSTIPGVHPQGYARPADALLDMTGINPTVAGASGGMISTAGDMNRFLTALVNGQLLHPSELHAMMTTRPAEDGSGSAYGLGLMSTPLPCGGLYWGHDGGIPGFRTLSGTTPDGRTATAMSNQYPGGSDAQISDMNTAVATALCEGKLSHGS